MSDLILTLPPEDSWQLPDFCGLRRDFVTALFLWLCIQVEHTGDEIFQGTCVLAASEDAPPGAGKHANMGTILEPCSATRPATRVTEAFEMDHHREAQAALALHEARTHFFPGARPKHRRETQDRVE
eukprot:g13471.t1